MGIGTRRINGLARRNIAEAYAIILVFPSLREIPVEKEPVTNSADYNY